MQTTFNVSPPQGMPGLPYDTGYKDVRSFPAKVAIGFGVLCELVLVGSIWEIQPVQDAGTVGSFLPVLAGVSMYDALTEQRYVGQGGAPGSAGYAAGSMVPVMRRGRIWGAFDGGGSWPEYAQVRVQHSSTGAFPQGVFTMTAASATVGHEIDLVPGAVLGIEPQLAQGAYTDGFGNSLTAAVVSLLLG